MPSPADSNLARGVELLVTLETEEAQRRGGLGVLDVARMVGREKSQVSRGLKTLAELGLVDRDPDTLDYRLGWRLFALAARAGDAQLLSLAPPVLGALVTRLGETVHLSVLRGTDVMTVLSEPSPSALRATGWIGRRVPAHCTSSGRALLLDHDADALRSLFGTGALEPAGPGAPRDVGELARRVAAARAQGHALVDEEREPGLVGAGAPVRDFRGRIVAALNVSAPKFRLTEGLAAAGIEVQRAADELSHRIGWRAT
jgi:IclR family transcriptional regulator, KDG regulon repressor